MSPKPLLRTDRTELRPDRRLILILEPLRQDECVFGGSPAAPPGPPIACNGTGGTLSGRFSGCDALMLLLLPMDAPERAESMLLLPIDAAERAVPLLRRLDATERADAGVGGISAPASPRGGDKPPPDAPTGALSPLSSAYARSILDRCRASCSSLVGPSVLQKCCRFGNLCGNFTLQSLPCSGSFVTTS